MDATTPNPQPESAEYHIGRREGERLLYAGKVRTGYTEEAARHVREYLDPYARKSTPLSVAVKKPKATWVEPIVEAEVAFSGITADGLLREAVFKGLREDLAPPRTQDASAIAATSGLVLTKSFDGGQRSDPQLNSSDARNPRDENRSVS
jgi:ATP-dependent DNA ligase